MAVMAAGIGALALGGPHIQRVVSAAPLPSRVHILLNHPAGPFTSMFWAPTWKWMLSVSNLLDYDRPVDKVSTVQQTALCATGFIWSRYSMVINPVNYNLFIVNVCLAMTGSYHLIRKIRHDMASKSSSLQA